MRSFNMQIKLIRSKLGRKFLMVFICCALLPLVTLSFVTYTLVAHELKDQIKNQLQRAAKSYGLTIYDHLLLVDARLQLLPLTDISPADASGRLSAIFDDTLKEHITAAVWLRPGTAPYALLGKIPITPPLPADIRPHLSSGRSYVLSHPIRGAVGHHVFMVRAVNPQKIERGLILVEINPKYLWSLGDANPLPPMTEFCVLDTDNHILVSTISFLDPKLEKLSTGPKGVILKTSGFEASMDQFIVSGWTLFLKPKFLDPGWKIILTQSNEEVLRPIHDFKRAFFLSILLTFWIILLFSIRYIRKSLVPMEKLKAATQRILRGEFDIPVKHRSNDEFDDLIASFNHMSLELGRQVQDLKVIARIGRRTAGITDPSKLLKIEIDIMQKALRFKHLLILLADSEHQTLSCEAGYGLTPSKEDSRCRVVISNQDRKSQDVIARTFTNKAAQWWQRPEKDRKPLFESDRLLMELTDAALLFCVPIVYEEQALGVIVVGPSDHERLPESDQALIKGIAAQTASGIFNALSIKRLQSSEERFRKIFDNAAAGMCLLNTNGIILKANARLGEIVGYEPERLKGLSWRDITHPEDVEITLGMARNLQGGAQGAELYEKRFIHQDGRTVPVLINTSLLHDESDSPLYYISHIQDLTQQKASEAERKKIELHLIQAQKMESLGTLAGGIAHDFNNLISAMMGQAELGGLNSEKSEKVKERFDGILQAAHRAKALVQQILAFTRQSNDRKQVVSIRQLAAEALELLSATLPANITVESHLEIEDDTVLADANQIHQVLMNLGTNAYHAMADGGGTLTLTLEHIVIGASNTGSAAGGNSGGHIKISVSDTGTGIAPENLEKIFDPYFTTKSKGKGTGLGLAMVHGIIKAHQGSIEVKSRAGRGTTFEILLPLQAAGTEISPKEGPLKTIAKGGERILFVDDDPILVEVGQEMLMHLGYQVEACMDSIKALDSLKADPGAYDLLITDFSMPKMNGDALAIEVRQLRPDLPVILCSGYQEWHDSPNNLSSALKAVLPKPFTLSELALTLRKVLE